MCASLQQPGQVKYEKPVILEHFVFLAVLDKATGEYLHTSHSARTTAGRPWQICRCEVSHSPLPLLLKGHLCEGEVGPLLLKQGGGVNH
jgi:hypothetical protein